MDVPCFQQLVRAPQCAVSLTVGKLKLMLERLLRVKAAQQALLLVPPESSGAQVGAASCCIAMCCCCAIRGGACGATACAASQQRHDRGWQVAKGAQMDPCIFDLHRSAAAAVQLLCRAKSLPPSTGQKQVFSRLFLLLLQPEDITDDDTRELRYYDVCDGCRWAGAAYRSCGLVLLAGFCRQIV